MEDVDLSSASSREDVRTKRRRGDSGRASESSYDSSARGGASSGSSPRTSKFVGMELTLLSIALLCMIAVAVTPITSEYYIFKIAVTVKVLIDTASDSFVFGVWGYCSTGIKNK